MQIWDFPLIETQNYSSLYINYRITKEHCSKFDDLIVRNVYRAQTTSSFEVLHECRKLIAIGQDDWIDIQAATPDVENQDQEKVISLS